VLVPSPEGNAPAICSGVLVSSRAVITAAHCFRGRDVGADGRVAGSATVVLGDVDAENLELVLGAIELHPTLDVALLGPSSAAETLSLERAGASKAFLMPHLTAIDASWVGAAVELAGYGASEHGGPGRLGFVVEEVTRLEPDHLVVTGRGQTGAYVGDSGGPLLGTLNDGRLSVLGVLDDGDPSCVGQDRYTRFDRLSNWDSLVRLLDENPDCSSTTALSARSAQ
jgi:hypothetical protein